MKEFWRDTSHELCFGDNAVMHIYSNKALDNPAHSAYLEYIKTESGNDKDRQGKADEV